MKEVKSTIFNSDNCFVNTVFMQKYNIFTILILFVKLKLFNKLSNNTISEIVSLSVIFPFSH